MEYPGTQFSDFGSNILRPIRIITTLYGGYVICLLLHKYYGNDAILNTLIFVFLSILVHASIMSYQLLNPDFKDFVYKYTTTGEFRGSYDYNFRMGGLSGGSGGAVLTVVQSLGVIISPFIFRKVNIISKIFVVMGSSLILFSVLICGRSGLWAVLIFLPLSILYSSRIRGVVLWSKSIISVFFIGLLLSGILVLFNKAEEKSPLYYALKRSLDTFIDYRDKGSFDDETIGILSNHIMFPNNLKTILIGDGEHIVNTQFERTLNSDIGYIKNIWGMGYFFALLFWFPILYFTIIAFKLRKKYESARILLILSLIMLLFHAKESYLYVRMFLSIYSLFLFWLYLDVRNKQNNIILSNN